jgi:hypothetical protein
MIGTDFRFLGIAALDARNQLYRERDRRAMFREFDQLTRLTLPLSARKRTCRSLLVVNR